MVVGGPSNMLLNFRGPMLRAFEQAGHDVHAAACDSDAQVKEALEAVNIKVHTFKMARTGMNPFSDLITLWSLYKLFRRIKPELVLCYTAKPVIYGCLAAWLSRVPRITAMISGIGNVFLGDTPGTKFPAWIVRKLYAFALRKTQVVFFQNPDDLHIFQSTKIITERQQAVQINGSGIDITHFPCTPMPQGPITFLLTARLLRDKGIVEYAQAAQITKKRVPNTRFLLLGAFDSNPTAIRPQQVTDWQQEGVLEYLHTTTDVRPILSQAHVFVLPSYYREGIPRSILESMAMGRVIITTDSVGCRETVQQNVNGYLVPPKDVQALAAAMIKVAQDPQAIPGMGQASRAEAIRRFDVNLVNKVIMNALFT